MPDPKPPSGVAERLGELLEAHGLHEMDAARLLLDCGCEQVHPFPTSLTTAQAMALGEGLDVNPPYLLGKEEWPGNWPHFYHNAPITLWSAITRAVGAGVLEEVLVLKGEGVDLDRLWPFLSTDDPRSLVAFVLKLRRPLGSYLVTTYQMWEPLPWHYPKSRYELLSVLLLLQALDERTRGGMLFRGLQIPVADMRAMVKREKHVACVVGHERWHPKWDVHAYLLPECGKNPGRVRDLRLSLEHYGDWREGLPHS